MDLNTGSQFSGGRGERKAKVQRTIKDRELDFITQHSRPKARMQHNPHFRFVESSKDSAEPHLQDGI